MNCGGFGGGGGGACGVVEEEASWVGGAELRYRYETRVCEQRCHWGQSRHASP